MDQLVTREAPEAALSRLQKELAEILRQRAQALSSPTLVSPSQRLRPVDVTKKATDANNPCGKALRFH